MGTTLDAVAVAIPDRRRIRHARTGALALTDEAARRALAEAGLGPGEVDILVNAGLYHDRALGEPALAALVQDDIGANREDPHGTGHGTFSFDVANGACGLLTGLRVVHGLLAAGTARHGLVVAGDAHPGRRLASHFPYAPAGAAIVCGWSDGPEGISGFRFANRPAEELSHAAVTFREGRNRLVIAEAPAFAVRAADLAAEVATEALAAEGLARGDVDLVVANPLVPAFLDGLRDHLDGAAVAPWDGPPVHTAGLAAAWDAARRQGLLGGARTVLLVSAGAGLTAGAAVLRRPGA